ncbi:site-specific integrase [uncultured Bacteroides sp.]|uniref:tyrosine-type recombinase/integrase n=1 Tax=uncultured Bacteroides sp. TaxID=162156 RepID=UPI002AAA8F0E|nr:site-specific integrase [uncultured Bacteroides sp.]
MKENEYYWCKQKKQMEVLSIFVECLKNELLDSGRHATARSYESALKRLVSFTGNQKTTFTELTPFLLKQYEEHLYSQGCRRNTVSLYMRMLRSICNQASRRGITNLPGGLFEEVFTGTESCQKRAVNPEVIRKLCALDLASSSASLAFSRDMFLLSFYLRGIPFVDLAHLRKSDLQKNTLTYRRSKTGHELTVSLEPCAMSLFRKYAPLVKNSPYLLPIITQIGENEYGQYQSALRLYNYHLHQLSNKLRLKEHLTSYVARHSWATAAYREGIPVAVISESLGHSSEKVTYNYLASFDNRTLKRANKKVIALVLPTSREGDFSASDIPIRRGNGKWTKRLI